MMNCSTIKFQIFLCAFLWLPVFSCSASPPLEGQTTIISKKYSNGDLISIHCKNEIPAECVVNSKIDGKKDKVPVNFHLYDIKPSMQQIALYVLSKEEDVYLFSIAVFCGDMDMDLVPDTIGIAECIAEFKVKNGAIIESPRVQVLPITTQSIFRKVQVMEGMRH